MFNVGYPYYTSWRSEGDKTELGRTYQKLSASVKKTERREFC